MRLLLGLLAPVLLGGCGLFDLLPEPTPPPENIPQVFRSQPVDGHPVRRVALLPFSDLSGHPREREQVENALVGALRRAQPFDLVRLEESALTRKERESYQRDGTIHQDTLVRLGKEHHIDAVLFGVMTRFSPYTPLVLGLKLDMVSAGAGDVIWEVNAVYDGADARVARDAHNFYKRRRTPDDSLEDYHIILVSPKQFTAYVCTRIVDTW